MITYRDKLTIDQISYHYGNQVILQDIQLEIKEKEFVSIIGPSGCGKSTFFHLVAGLEQPTSGRILLDEHDVSGKPGHASYMMQDDGLLPWRTVIGNILLASEIDGQSIADTRMRARQLLPIFGLKGYENAYPSHLSGGMRQRVALMRTVMAKQALWLFDEPFASLDAITREEMQDWLLSIWEKFANTVILVTHSIEEAIYLSDRVILFSSLPATIRCQWRIPFSRPRQREMAHRPEFLALRQEIRAVLAN